MSFPSAGSYNNLPNGVFDPVIYSKSTLLYLRENTIADQVTTTGFYGEISDYGSEVRILKQPKVTVFDYVRGQLIQPQPLLDEQISLVIDKSKGFCFAIDDIERAHSHVDYAEMALNSGAYELAKAYDQDVLRAMMLGAGAGSADLGTDTVSGSKPIGFGSSDISPVDMVGTLLRDLRLQNVPEDELFLIADPYFFQALYKEDSKMIDASITGDATSPTRQGIRAYRSSVWGFTMYVTTHTPLSASQSFRTIIAGHKGATAAAKNLVKQENFRSPDTFGDQHRGLLVWGRKVIRPEALKVAYVSYT